MVHATNKEVLVPDKLRLQALELASVWNIYDYLRLNHNNFNYVFYKNRRISIDNIEDLGLKSLDRVLDEQNSNCLDVNIIFFLMLIEIRVKPRMWYGTVKLADGNTYKHVWISIDGEIWDLTVRTGRNYKKIKELRYNKSIMKLNQLEGRSVINGC